MFTTKAALIIQSFLTTMFLLFANAIQENPSIFNIAILTLITILIVLLITDKGAE
jgi:hypothetical protein